MLRRYIQAAMQNAHYEIPQDDHSYYGEIEGLNGIFANADSLEACREELEEVLEEWIFCRISKNLQIPVMGGIELSIKEVV